MPSLLYGILSLLCISLTLAASLSPSDSWDSDSDALALRNDKDDDSFGELSDRDTDRIVDYILSSPKRVQAVKFLISRLQPYTNSISNNKRNGGGWIYMPGHGYVKLNSKNGGSANNALKAGKMLRYGKRR